MAFGSLGATPEDAVRRLVQFRKIGPIGRLNLIDDFAGGDGGVDLEIGGEEEQVGDVTGGD